jgi:hypothetical protein
LLLAGVPASASPEAAPAGIEIVDVSPAFWSFWDTAEQRPEVEQVRLFFSMVVAKYPELFSAGVLHRNALAGRADDRQAQQLVAAYLREVRAYVPRMRAISAAVRRDHDAYVAGFRAAFPGYRPDKPVYFTFSLFTFDGGTRNVLGKVPVLFGIDGIARFHGADDNVKVLFDHELFHDYHAQIIPETALDDLPLWLALWEEGLATYASDRLNPGSSESEILLSKDLAASVRPLMPRLAREVLRNFDSMAKDEYETFFLMGKKRTDVPDRAGYYLGYAIARTLGDHRALDELAQLTGPELKDAVRQALEAVAAGPQRFGGRRPGPGGDVERRGSAPPVP